jgi:hypothetical protein
VCDLVFPAFEHVAANLVPELGERAWRTFYGALINELLPYHPA